MREKFHPKTRSRRLKYVPTAVRASDSVPYARLAYMHLGLCTTYCDDQRGLWMIRGPSYRAFRIQTHNRRNYPAPVFVSSQGDPMNAFHSHLCSRLRFDSTDRLGGILKAQPQPSDQPSLHRFIALAHPLLFCYYYLKNVSSG